jgi:hypothetical protein
MEDPKQYILEKPIDICVENFGIFQYVYLIHIRSNIYKIGRVFNTSHNCLPEFFKGYNVLLYLEVDDCVKFTNDIINTYSELFIKVKIDQNSKFDPSLGFFYGNGLEMMYIIMTYYMNNHRSLIHESTNYDTQKLDVKASTLAN